MREMLEQRLTDLRAEYENGERLLAEHEARIRRTRDTLLRIAGAIQVLEEALGTEATDAAADTLGESHRAGKPELEQ